MKEIFYLVLFNLTCGFSSAQTTVASPVIPDKKSAASAIEISKSYYCCRNCDYTATTLRSCPVHSSLLIKVGSWYCSADGKSFRDEGICPEHHTGLTQMKMKFKTAKPRPQELKKADPRRK